MNISLKQVVLKLYAGGIDDGDPTFGSAITICVDEFNFSGDLGEIDVTCGQASVKQFRKGAVGFTAGFTAKIGTGHTTATTGWLSVAMSNDLGKIEVDLTTSIGGKLEIVGLIRVGLDGNEVPTGSVELLPYGILPVWTNAA